MAHDLVQILSQHDIDDSGELECIRMARVAVLVAP